MNESVDVEVIPSSSMEIVEATERAQIDIQVATAHRYPRTLSKVKEQVIEMATVDQETAEECFYALPRAGKTIEGPGVRLAEIIVSCYGNIRANSYVVDVGQTELTVRGECWDIEKNVGFRVEVKRRITNKQGHRYKEDMIITTQNAAMAIAFRNAVFKVIPMSLFKKEMVQIKRVSLGADRPIEEIRTKCVNSYQTIGVTVDKLLEFVEKRRVSDLDLEDISKLKGIYTAIKEGSTTIDALLNYRKEKGAPLSAGKHDINPEKEKESPASEESDAKAEEKKAAAKKKRAEKKAQKEAEAQAQTEETPEESQAPLEGGPVNIDDVELPD